MHQETNIGRPRRSIDYQSTDYNDNQWQVLTFILRKNTFEGAKFEIWSLFSSFTSASVSLHGALSQLQYAQF